MEHRNFQRKEVRAEARVRCHDGRTMPACILNVGGEGAFLEVEGMEDRYQNHIEVEFPLTRNGVIQNVCWPALVIHRSPHGVGVLFLSEEGDVAPVLRQLARERGVTTCTGGAIAEAKPKAKVLPLRPREASDNAMCNESAPVPDPCIHHHRAQDVVGG